MNKLCYHLIFVYVPLTFLLFWLSHFMVLPLYHVVVHKNGSFLNMQKLEISLSVVQMCVLCLLVFALCSQRQGTVGVGFRWDRHYCYTRRGRLLIYKGANKVGVLCVCLFVYLICGVLCLLSWVGDPVMQICYKTLDYVSL